MIAKSILEILLTVSAATLAFAASPVGGGSWQSTSPGFSVQDCNGGEASGSTFTLPKTATGSNTSGPCSNGHPRAEREYDNSYSSGTHQFGGTFKISSFSGTNVVLKQTFNGNTGPFFLLAVKSNGDLYSVEGGATIASGVAKVGSSVTINTVHNAGAQTYDVYVNGAKKFSESAPGGSFYDKVGAYTSDSGSGPISVTWSSVSFWTQ